MRVPATTYGTRRTCRTRPHGSRGSSHFLGSFHLLLQRGLPGAGPPATKRHAPCWQRVTEERRHSQECGRETTHRRWASGLAGNQWCASTRTDLCGHGARPTVLRSVHVTPVLHCCRVCVGRGREGGGGVGWVWGWGWGWESDGRRKGIPETYPEVVSQKSPDHVQQDTEQETARDRGTHPLRDLIKQRTASPLLVMPGKHTRHSLRLLPGSPASVHLLLRPHMHL